MRSMFIYRIYYFTIRSFFIFFPKVLSSFLGIIINDFDNFYKRDKSVSMILCLINFILNVFYIHMLITLLHILYAQF